MNVPKLRFKEFDEEWETYSLADIADFQKGKNIKKNELSSEGELCILYGELYTKYGEVTTEIYSKTNIESKELIKSKKYDVLIPSSGETAKDIACSTCVLQENILIGGDLNILRFKNNIDGRFISYQINGIKKQELSKYAQGATVVHLYSQGIKKLYLKIPNLEEQQKISNLLLSLDEKIQLQQQKIDLLQEQKKGFLQKMFPKADEAQPEMRFAGFTGDWEERALKEVGDFVRTSIDPQAAPDSEFIEYSMPSYDNGRLPEHVLGKSMQSMRLKISGEVLLINKLNVRQKRIWLIEDAPDNAVASNEFMPFTSEKIDMTFLEQLMLSDKTTRDLESISSGTSNSQKRITPPDVLKYQIKLPKERDEQEKIGIFFKQLDNIIVLHQQKIDIYKEQKKGFMQQMFI